MVVTTGAISSYDDEDLSVVGVESQCSPLILVLESISQLSLAHIDPTKLDKVAIGHKKILANAQARVQHRLVDQLLPLLNAPQLQHLCLGHCSESDKMASMYGLITPARFPALRTLHIGFLKPQFTRSLPEPCTFVAHPNLEALHIDDAAPGYGL